MEDDQLCNAGATDTDIRELITDNTFSELTVLLVATEGLRKSFAFESSGVSRSGPNQPPSGVIGSSHTQDMGIERMITSVNISDQACARYIIVVSMQAPGVALKPVQFSEMGKHCRRFAAKKAMVHVMVRPIITHEMTEKVFVMKILARRSSSLVMLLWND